MADLSDVPPLEDMTDLLEKVNLIKEKREKRSPSSTSKVNLSNGHEQSQKKEGKDIDNSNSSDNSKSKPALSSQKSKPETKPSTGFGGMKKGFMFGGNSKPKQTKTESIPYIKKNDEALKIGEVQKAMNDTITEKKDEWLTDDLMKNIEQNGGLMKKLQDPQFMEAVHLFQTNPTAAMEKYKNDKETQEAFLQFCSLMGNHFTNIADKQPKPESPVNPPPKIQEINPEDSTTHIPSHVPSASQRGTIITRQPIDGADMSVRSSTNPKQATADDEKKMQEILSKPENMEVLMDPWVQNLLQMLRTDPNIGQRLLMEADPTQKQKIHKLVTAGLLQFQV